MAIERYYALAGLKRASRACDASLHATTTLESTFDPRRGLQRITVARAGADLRAQVEAALRANDAELVHVDLGLDDPAVEAAVEDRAG